MAAAASSSPSSLHPVVECRRYQQEFSSAFLLSSRQRERPSESFGGTRPNRSRLLTLTRAAGDHRAQCSMTWNETQNPRTVSFQPGHNISLGPKRLSDALFSQIKKEDSSTFAEIRSSFTSAAKIRGSAVYCSWSPSSSSSSSYADREEREERMEEFDWF